MDVSEGVVLRDKRSGVSRGCGFVRMASRGHANSAMHALHNAGPLGTSANPLQ
ncbi:hypothetical protein T484DRAFT_1764191, partial [Baffinella frigidus]